MILAAVINLLLNRVEMQCGSRVYIDGLAPENPSFPYVSVLEVSVMPVNLTHDDPGALQDETIVQVNFYYRGLQAFKVAQSDARLARLALHGYRGEVQIETGDVVTIDSCLMTGGTTYFNEIDRSLAVQREFTIVHSV